MKRRTVPQIMSAAFAVLLIINYSCADHNFGAPFFVDCNGVEAVSYAADVAPIIEQNCAISGCHDGTTDLPNWTDLSNLQNTDYNKEIQRRITLPLTDGDKMPAEGSITQEEREAIYCWISQGAQDN